MTPRSAVNYRRNEVKSLHIVNCGQLTYSLFWSTECIRSMLLQIFQIVSSIVIVYFKFGSELTFEAVYHSVSITDTMLSTLRFHTELRILQK